MINAAADLLTRIPHDPSLTQLSLQAYLQGVGAWGILVSILAFYNGAADLTVEMFGMVRSEGPGVRPGLWPAAGWGGSPAGVESSGSRHMHITGRVCCMQGSE